jgi:hypothetical protein
MNKDFTCNESLCTSNIATVNMRRKISKCKLAALAKVQQACGYHLK